MYHERAVGLLSPQERQLIKGCFDDDGQQVTSITSLERGPARQALARYGWAREKVMKHVKKRKTEGEKFTISIPEFIWLQPCLSFMEKHLLADVYELQQKPLGCFKSNWGFAIELGTTEGNVRDMLYRLRSCRFLDEQPDEIGERLLTLSKHFLKLVGQCPLTSPSVPTDQEVSAHLPSRQCPLTKASVPADHEQEQNLDETRMDIDESEAGDAPRLQGDFKLNQQQPQAEAATRRAVVVEGKKSTGAAAPEDPRRGASPPATPHPLEGKRSRKQEGQGASRYTQRQAGRSQRESKQSDSSKRNGQPEPSRSPQPAAAPPAQSAKGERETADDPEAGCEAPKCAAADPALATSAPAREAQKLLQLFSDCYWDYFGRNHKVQQQDVDIATRYFQGHPERTALEVANYLFRAWQLSSENDGPYGFGCCKQAKSVAGFFKYLERDDGKRGIVEDVEGQFDSYWSCEEEWLLRSLRKVCHDNEVIKNVFADELGQINEQMKAEDEAEDKRSAEAKKQREQTGKRAEAERLARIENPSRGDLVAARDNLLRAYRIALGTLKGLSAPFGRVDYSCKMLGCDPPALREWYEHYDSRGRAPTNSEDAVPDKLRIRLQDEYDDISEAVAAL